MSAQDEFNHLIMALGESHDAQAGQMFGKKCIKVNGKAAVALFKEYLVFKLTGDEHTKALSLADSELWDPSGKGRAMKEWVQVSMKHKKNFAEFAIAAAAYVG